MNPLPIPGENGLPVKEQTRSFSIHQGTRLDIVKLLQRQKNTVTVLKTYHPAQLGQIAFGLLSSQMSSMESGEACLIESETPSSESGKKDTGVS